MITRKYTVYKIIFPGGEIYIGQTSTPLNYRKNGGYRHSPRVLEKIAYYQSIDPTFDIELIPIYQNLSKDDADIWEIYYIKYFRDTLGYDMVLNEQDGGSGSYVSSIASRKKMSESTKRTYANHPELLEQKFKSVDQYDIHGNFIARYKSIAEASKITGINRGNISYCVLGGVQTAGGFLWCEANKDCKTFDSIPNRFLKVNQYDRYGNLIATYDSVINASEKTGIPTNNIHACISGCKHTAGNYEWHYDDGKIYPIHYLPKSRIIQRDPKTGNIIAIFETVKDAANSLGIDRHTVTKIIKDKYIPPRIGNIILEKE